MSPNDDAPEETVQQAEEGSAGEPQSVDEETAQAMAEQPETLPEEALDERQARIGERRRSGGPPLEGTEVADRVEADAISQPALPTECAEAPESDKAGLPSGSGTA